MASSESINTDEPAATKPDIPEFFQAKCVFITGASGFMGKILVEKLLRSCPDIGTLYLLMRAKRGLEPEQRMRDLIKNKVFARVRSERGEDKIIRQLKVIEGDVSKIGLGLSTVSRMELTRNVSVVFHAAASVKFDESLRSAIILNTRGTREIIALAKDMTNLKALVHVSTMFSNCQHDHILEEIYPTNAEPDRLIQCAEWMDEKWMDAFTPLLLEGRPNTYVYSKSLAEKLISDASKTLPVAIFRPSIVMSTLNEPEAGWLENLNGPSVVVASGGTGMLRRMHCNGDKIAHIAPADLAINAIIALAWYVATFRPAECEVLNYTPPAGHGLTWSRMMDNFKRFYHDYPFSKTFNVPRLVLSESKAATVATQFYLLLWAHLVDLASSLMGHKKQLARIQKKINNATFALIPFTTRAWEVDTNNVLRVSDCLSARDKERFTFDLRNLRMDEYAYQYALGVRRHVMGESDSTVAAARSRITRMKWISRCIKTVLLALLYFFLFSPFMQQSPIVTTNSTIISQ